MLTGHNLDKLSPMRFNDCMSKTLLFVVIVISFVAVAVLGFTAIGGQGCIASIATGGTCPAAGNFSIIEFYLTTFKSFSVSVIQLALLIAMLVVTTAIISIARLPLSLVVRSSRKQQELIGFSLLLRRKLSSWLALSRSIASDRS